jgi:hypothetical protein
MCAPRQVYWVHQLKLRRTDLHTQRVDRRRPVDDPQADILSLLRQSLFSLVWTIADSLDIRASRVYSRLVEKIGFRHFFLHRVPRILTDELRQKGVELVRQLLQVLQRKWRVGYGDIVTSDESWLLQHCNHRKIWCISAYEVSTRAAYTIPVRKTTFTVFLSVHRAVFINWLSPRKRFNSGYFCHQIHEPLSQILHSGRAAGSPKPIMHFDNNTPHRLAGTENCFQSYQFPHFLQPPYNREISPGDIFLFRDLKMKLKGEQFGTMQELQAMIDMLLD